MEEDKYVTRFPKTRHVAKILKIAIAHLHDANTHDLLPARIWKRSPVQFLRIDAFYSPVSAILESRNYVLNTLLRRWVWSPYTAASHTSEHVRFVKKQLTKTRTTTKEIEPGKDRRVKFYFKRGNSGGACSDLSLSWCLGLPDMG